MEDSSDHRRSHLLQLPGGSWDGVPGLQEGKEGWGSDSTGSSRPQVKDGNNAASTRHDVCTPVRVCIHSVSTEIWQRGTFSCQRATL